MNKNKMILTHCPNFYKIINFEFLESDKLTAMLIEIYRNYIFSIDPSSAIDIKKVEKLDDILMKYLDDYFFQKEMKNGLMNIKVGKTPDILAILVEKILELFDNYETGYTRNIYFARWI